MEQLAAFEINTQAIMTQMTEWFVQAVPNLIAALLILIFGYAIAVWAGRAANRLITRNKRFDPMLGSVVSSIVRYALTIIVFVAALGQLGFQTTSLIAALGAAGIAIGLALQNTLSNIAAGFMLLWLRPFRIGDYIEVPSTAGTVKDVGLFATELHSWDGIYQFVPNSQLWNTSIINYTRLERRLVEVQYGVAYDDDIQTGRDTLLGLARSDARVLQEPAQPFVFVDRLDDSSVVLSLRLWTATSNYWDVRRDMTELGKLRLEEAGLRFPFPQLDVHADAGIAGNGAIAED